MYQLGLVSVSFRQHTPWEIIAAAKQAGLACIEWGSDVHAPCSQPDRLKAIREEGESSGISCCSYGTYFRIGVNHTEEILPYIAGAKLLGTDILRVWCGDRDSERYGAKEREQLFAQCRELAGIAKDNGVTLCMECHGNTFTNRAEGALALVEAVRSQNIQLYWQPNQFRTLEENLTYARKTALYTRHIHVFFWKEYDRFPLAEGRQAWKEYLKEFPGERALLLEFMPDNRIETLPMEAETLRQIIWEEA